MKTSFNQVFAIAFLAVVAGVLTLVPETAHAIAAPVAGDFAYDLYDIAAKKILGGPIGFTAGVGAVAYGAVQGWMGNMWGAVPAILGGAALIKAESITTSLGMIC